MADILTIPQRAVRLQVSERNIYELTREKNRKRQRVPLPCIRIGRCVRFESDNIDKWLLELQEMR
jgi:predicted DNA-binding transcriptional regulator AlpA